MLYLKTVIFIDALMVIGLVLFRYALAARYQNVVSAKLTALALFTPVVALFCGNIYLLCSYLVAAVAFNSRSRAELASTYVFLLPLIPILSVETGVGSIYLLAISTVAAMNLGALIGFAVTSGRRSLAQTRFDIGVLLLVGMFIFIYNRDASATAVLRGAVINVIGFAGPYLLLSRGLGTRNEIERLLLRLSLGAVVTAVTACFQSLRHWILFETYYPALHVSFPITSWSLAMRAGLLRTGGSMLDPSAAGLFFAAILTMMPMLQSRFRPMGFWAMIAILGGGLIVTQSRGAWLAAIVGMLFVMAYRGHWGRVALLAGTSIVAEVAILLLATSGRIGALLGKGGEASGTVTYRQDLLSQGLEQVRAHPLLGQTPDRLIANLTDLVQGEHIVDFVNVHLFIAMTAGIPLFVIWICVWLSPVLAAWRQRRMPGADLTEGYAAIIVSVMVAIAATSLIDRNVTWLAISLGLAGPCLAIGRQRMPAGAKGIEYDEKDHRTRSRLQLAGAAY